MDKDNNGKISSTEVQNALAKLGRNDAQSGASRTDTQMISKEDLEVWKKIKGLFSSGSVSGLYLSIF
jgi:hypothetical protein